MALAHGVPSGNGLAHGATPVAAPVLTARQLDILLMLDQGYANKAIALQLGLAEKTVKNHITGLFNVLGVVNRLQAIRQARNAGLLN
jgi:DNA-binding NarL/FixJ family response regulator